MKSHKHSLAQLKAAIKKSTSMRQILIVLKVSPFGGNYDVLREAINHFSLYTPHFIGQAGNKGKKLDTKVLIQNYLSNIKPITLKSGY